MTTPGTNNMYYEFHVPLGIYNAIRRLLAQRSDSPNSPDPIVDASKGREWFSQPRPAQQGEVPKPTFLYATGTAYMLDLFGQGVGQIGGGGSFAVPGLDGKIFYWDGAPANDPFYKMVDSSLWTAKKIQFADSAFPMGSSIAEGVQRTIDMINDTPGAFALGGYSQGAAVVSRVYEEIRSGSLRHRRADLLTGVTFGNPTREAGHLWPGAEPVGGWDDPTNFLSHGCFPLSMRLKNTEDLWWDFANENEIITSVIDSVTGLDWVALTGVFLGGFQGVDIAAFIASQLNNLRFNVIGDVFDVLNQVVGGVGDSGHVAYPLDPPPGDPQDGLTSYQIALQHLRDVGQKYQDLRTFSQKTEVLQVNFKVPVPINDVAFQAVKVPVKIDMWYRDRQDNWRAVLDENRDPVTLTLDASPMENWHSYHAYTSPTVAKAVQFRMTRLPNSDMGNRPYCVAMRNVLMRRNIYDRPAGIRATTITEDALGNVVETYIKDWDAPLAIDNNPATFWRSAAQPVADSVVALYLDLRTADGSPQIIDTLYIDPVYTGAALNVYYTNDEPEGVTVAPSPISVMPIIESHNRWQAGRGLWDVSTGSETSEFTAPFRVGPMVKKNCWIGVEWAPDFTATSPPSSNPVLFEVIPDNPEPGQFWPRLYYDVGNLGYGKIVLEFTNGTTSKYFDAPLSPPLTQNEPLRIVAGWAYDAPGSAVLLTVMSKGTQVGYSYTPNTLSLPNLVTFDGKVSFSKYRGQFTAHVVKTTGWLNTCESFLVNPVSYVDPDPISPDSMGQTTSSTLDNTIFSCDWTSQRYPVGGTDPSHHVDRRWTPIWRDYTVQRGKLFFPRQISCKYLKLEFSKLTPEPYPVYDTGIVTTTETFPVSVMAEVTTTTSTSTVVPGTSMQATSLPSSVNVHTPGAIENIIGGVKGAINGVGDAVNGLLGSIGNLIGGIASVNWLDPRSVNAAVEASSVSTVQPVQAAIGIASDQPSVRNTISTALGQSTGAMADPTTSIALRGEASSSMVYRRTTMQPQVLAGNAINQIMGAMPNHGLGATVSTPIATAISTTFAPTVSSPGAAPVTPAMGKDYWVFPGGLLKMPAAILEGIFSGVQWGLFGTNSTVSGNGSIPSPVSVTVTNTTPTTQRLRFNSTETHVYRKMTVTRTAAVAYFAGIREIAAYNTTYIDYEDPLSFDFKVYDPNQWRFTNVKQTASGAVTVAGSVYNADLDLYNLDSWNLVGDWSWDGSQDNYSGNRVGTASIVADGTELSMVSNKPFAVNPDDEIVIASSVKYVGAVSVDYPDAFGTNYKGTYNNGADYNPGDVVLYDGYYYRRTGESNPGYAPGTAYWGEAMNPTAQLVMDIITYFEGEEVGVETLTPAPANTAAEGYIAPGKLSGYASRVAVDHPTGKTDGVTFEHLLGTYAVPSDGVDAVAVRFRITSGVTAGQFWIGEVKAEPRTGSRGYLYDRFITFSKFSKVVCDFRDSGLRRSDRMWAINDPLNNTIDKGTLAWYTTPTTMPPGMWGDQFAAWADENVKWGNARATVAIWIDPDRQYKGNRALHFRRAAGSGSAGVRVRQETNYFPGAQARICCTFYKPLQNSNFITLRLRRVSDGVYIHEEVIPNPPVGQWYTYTSDFFEVPNTLDQVYIVEIDLTGTFEDELYVSDLYTEIAHVRYFMRLGGVSNPNSVNIDVTELAHSGTTDAIVTCTEPTNEVALEVVLLSPQAVAYGATMTPIYQQ